ncbi:ArsR family transcriptional regulator [Brevibacillus fluminis]|uniref:ArsR family transcriptional regulator n=1 Tax=Brevibacillus fluminis TaxID=511487 RepID=A0A3M8DXP4_9BACL|nr:metalloregulator ArsR/SmtB family transcription factor [Brevibacillus fluminis]RNB92315.1 ArsR family transcriptional regulator [Brevibacillus fluminis]
MEQAKQYDVFEGIADPTRRAILSLLSVKQMNVTELSGRFPVTRTAVSKHLRILKGANLIKEEKSGREKIYRLNPQALREVKEWLNHYEQFWDEKIMNLKNLFPSE